VVTAVGKTTAERRLVAYVVPEDGGRTDSRHDDANAEAATELGLETTLQAFLAQKLPEHMNPSRIVLLDRLPLTPNGKVDYRSLPEPDVATLTQETGHAAPRNDTEAALVEVWQEVLRAGEVGIHDSFFELGGDSVNAIQVVSRANRKGYQLAPIMIFRYPTVAGLARQLAGPPGSHEDREEMAL
jgi:aryl carrier-like protein